LVRKTPKLTELVNGEDCLVMTGTARQSIARIATNNDRDGMDKIFMIRVFGRTVSLRKEVPGWLLFLGKEKKSRS
jgi:hypothetical protein